MNLLHQRRRERRARQMFAGVSVAPQGARGSVAAWSTFVWSPFHSTARQPVDEIRRSKV